MDPVEKAAVLAEALPYIRRFAGKMVVIKYGGSTMVDPALTQSVALDVALLKFVGIHPVLVHGGGPEISRMMKRLGLTPTFRDGLRVTDSAALEVTQMVLVGRVNRDLVAALQRAGARAVGLSGQDGGLLVGRRYRSSSGEVDLGLVGEVTEVRPDLIHTLSGRGYVPVIAPLALTPEGETLNINADWVAGDLAGALGAEKLVFLTDVAGVYAGTGGPAENGPGGPGPAARGPGARGQLLSHLGVEEARALLARGVVGGGMVPKLQACVRAVERGVPRAHIIDGRTPHALLLEIFTDAGVGTMVEPDPAPAAERRGA